MIDHRARHREMARLREERGHGARIAVADGGAQRRGQAERVALGAGRSEVRELANRRAVLRDEVVVAGEAAARKHDGAPQDGRPAAVGLERDADHRAGVSRHQPVDLGRGPHPHVAVMRGRPGERGHQRGAALLPDGVQARDRVLLRRRRRLERHLHAAAVGEPLDEAGALLDDRARQRGVRATAGRRDIGEQVLAVVGDVGHALEAGARRGDAFRRRRGEAAEVLRSFQQHDAVAVVGRRDRRDEPGDARPDDDQARLLVSLAWHRGRLTGAT